MPLIDLLQRERDREGGKEIAEHIGGEHKRGNKLHAADSVSLLQLLQLEVFKKAKQTAVAYISLSFSQSASMQSSERPSRIIYLSD